MMRPTMTAEDERKAVVRRMSLCLERSEESGDPPCWDACPEAYAKTDCTAFCARDAGVDLPPHPEARHPGAGKEG